MLECQDIFPCCLWKPTPRLSRHLRPEIPGQHPKTDQLMTLPLGNNDQTNVTFSLPLIGHMSECQDTFPCWKPTPRFPRHFRPEMHPKKDQLMTLPLGNIRHVPCWMSFSLTQHTHTHNTHATHTHNTHATHTHNTHATHTAVPDFLFLCCHSALWFRHPQPQRSMPVCLGACCVCPRCRVMSSMVRLR
jgi:hypothetical protein